MSRKVRRENLYRKDPHCYFCGVHTKPPSKAMHPKAKPPDNMATVEHLDTRLDMHRGEAPQGFERTVLACHKCNQERGVKRMQQEGVEELRRRARRSKASLSWGRAAAALESEESTP